jgi:hypothetical protein
MRAVAVVVGTLLLAVAVSAADAGRPHPHRGLLAPFTTAPPAPTLRDDERRAIDRGDVIVRDMEGRSDGRRMVVFTVDAPPERVWAVVSRFSAFPTYIDEVKQAVVLDDGPDGTVVAFTVSQFGFTLTYYVRHRYDAARREGTWTLDYTKESDLDDSVGFWRVTPWPGAPGKSLVEHSTHVALKTAMPGFLRAWIADNSLRSTGDWVRKHATTK